MENTQLQEVLQKFTKTDVRRFSDYIASPYFNKKKTLVDFWEAIKKFAPAFAISRTEKEQLFSVVFGMVYNDAYYRNVCSDMLKEILNFLMLENIEKSDISKLEHKMEALRGLGLIDLLEKQLNLAEKQLQNTEEKYVRKLAARIRFGDLRGTLIIRRNRIKHENAGAYLMDRKMNLELMDYALAKCFLNQNNQFRATQSAGKEFDRRAADQYFQIYENGLCTDDIFVRAYYLVAQLTINDNKQHFPELKKIMLTEKSISNPDDLENLLIGTLTFISVHVELNEPEWRNEMFEIYDFRLKKGLWTMNGSLGYTSLHNIVINAITLNKIKYAEDIVKEYSQYVDAGIRKHVTELCLGWIEFYKGNTAAAHEHLLGIETENIMIKYELRTLQCMIYFEQKEYLALMSFLDSFKHFIAYNQNFLEPSISVSRSKLCNYMGQLAKLQMDPDRKHADKLKTELLADNFLMKEWFLTKI